MLINKGQSLALSAEKAGMTEKTARKYLKSGLLPDEIKKDHIWRTREDPFKEDEKSLKDLLESNPLLEAKTVFEHLQENNPGKYHQGQLRTLQRRFKQWRALDGPAKEVIFPQVHHPGDKCESDFTSMNEINITIRGVKFEHLVYHFILTYSNWQTGTICRSESFEALSNGFQRALWELGGVPCRHQTDSLSAAVRNTGTNPEVFTERYSAIIRHYRMEAMKIEPGKANQNGDTEQSHNRLKKIMDQQLMLRGSRDFESIEEYTDYLMKIFGRMNSLVKKRFTEELAYLKPLPSYKIDMMKKEIVKVKSWSTVTISHNVYSVHSRLIGEWVTAKLLPDTIEIWYAQRCVEVLPRLKGRKKHFVQYRHVIDYLMRKPGAFENYIYKEDLFPTHRFRVAYDYLHDVNPQKAVKEYLKILFLAATESESLVDDAIELLIRQEVAITFDAVNEIVLKGMRLEPMREVKVMAVDTTIYDALLQQRQDGGVAA